MTTTLEQKPSIEPLVDQLLTTLSREHTLLEELDARLEAKLEAIRTRDVDRLAETTHDISRTNRRLDTLAETRGRQMDALGKTLGASTPVNSLDKLLALDPERIPPEMAETVGRWQTKMREQAGRTQRRCEEVTFALQYATRLGQEMLQALRGQMPAPAAGGSDGYTASGTAAPSTQTSSLVNHVG